MVKEIMHALRKTIMVGLIFSGVILAPVATTAGDATVNEELVSRHLAAFGAGDIESLLAGYSDDAFITTPHGTIRGKDEIRTFFEETFLKFRKEGVLVNLTYQSCDGDTCQIIWDVETLGDSYDFGTDTFLIKDGKIVAETIGAKVRPKAK